MGDALAGAGARVAVGIEEDRALTSSVAKGMSHGALDFCGRLTLGGLAGLLSRCAVIVSNDSEPLHLAVAAGAATVGIYWAPNLVIAGPFARARHRPALSWHLDCPFCGANFLAGDDCDHDASMVAVVTRGGGRGGGVGVTRCFYRASLISYVTASASYRRSGMSCGARNTLSSAPSSSVLLPVARTNFTTVVPGVVEGRALHRVGPHAVPAGTLA